MATSSTTEVAASHLAQLGHLLVARAQRSAELDRGDRARISPTSLRLSTATSAPSRPHHLVCRVGSSGRPVSASDSPNGICGPEPSGTSTEPWRCCTRPCGTTPAGSINTAGDLFNLGNVLWIRYGRTRRLDDLDAALSALQRAATATPERSTDRPGCLNSLAVALSERYGRTGAVSDLDECGRLLREAAAAAPQGTPDHTVIIANLGNALRMQARVRGAEPLHSEAVAVLRSALQTARETGLPRAGACHNLASALLGSVSAAPSDTALDEAIGLLTEALSLTPDDAVELPRYRTGFGRALRIRFSRTGDSEDYRRGIEELAEAGRGALAVDLELAVDAARIGAQWAVAQHDATTAASAYRTALTGVHRLVAEQAARPHQEVWLRKGGDLVSQAALTFLRAPDADAREAAVALEQGRAFLLAEALDLRAGALDQLTVDAPPLAARFRAAAERLAATRTTAAGTASLSRPALQPPDLIGGAT